MFQEALWAEGPGLRKDGRVIVDEFGAHGDGRHLGNSVAVVFNHVIREAALEATRYAVTDAKTFCDDSS